MSRSERSTGHINELSGSADRRAGGGPMLEQARRTAEQLQTTLSVLATIDHAIGILIGRGGGSAEEATAALRDVSRSHDTDLGTVARQIVEGVASPRARPVHHYRQPGG
jgi:ANTAR domain